MLFLYVDSRKIAAKRCEDNQEKESPVPPPVKNIAGKNKKSILPTKPVVQHPIDAKHNRQEKCVCYRIKCHSVAPVLLLFTLGGFC
jgi:hypothetical protein